MNNLLVAAILSNVKEDDHNNLLQQTKSELREEGINPSKKKLRARFKSKLKKLGKNEDEISCIVKSVMGSEKVTKSKDFPKTKGKEYKQIKDSVTIYLQKHFGDLKKEYASEEELKNMISDALDMTPYRYLSKHINDLTSDILKSLKTMNVYVVEKPNGKDD